jgi:hypothetical protein
LGKHLANYSDKTQTKLWDSTLFTAVLHGSIMTFGALKTVSVYRCSIKTNDDVESTETKKKVK